MPKIREIQLVDDDGTVRGSITDKYAINMLTRYSDLIKFLRNAREFNKPAKSNEQGILRIPVSKDAINDERLDDIVAFLNGEMLYEYNNVKETMFRNKVFNENMNKNFRQSIYTGLQYFLLPENILEKLLHRQTVAPRRGEYENEIEKIMKKRQYEINTLGSNTSTAEFTAEYPEETFTMTQPQFEKWLRSNGLQKLQNHRPEEHYYNSNEENMWNEENERMEYLTGAFNQGRLSHGQLQHLMGQRGPMPYIPGYFPGRYRGGIKHHTRAKKYKQKHRKTRKRQ
jgi:hypothetical protein